MKPFLFMDTSQKEKACILNKQEHQKENWKKETGMFRQAHAIV